MMVSSPHTSQDPYPGDRDKAAASRLQVQHNVSKAALGGLVFAPLDLRKPDFRVLDSGTADGYWLFDLSHQLAPSVVLVGTDIASFPSSFPAPPNLILSIHSYKDPWPEKWQSYFDLVQQRFCLAGCANKEEALFVIRGLIGLVKPGGWIQLVDSELPQEPIDTLVDSPATQMLKSMTQMLRSHGQKTDWGRQAKSLLDEAGGLLDLDSKQVVTKLGEGAPSSELREDGIHNVMAMTRTLGPKLAAMSEPPLTQEKLGEFRPKILKEAETVGVDKPYFAAWGRRPLG